MPAVPAYLTLPRVLDPASEFSLSLCTLRRLQAGWWAQNTETRERLNLSEVPCPGH